VFTDYDPQSGRGHGLPVLAASVKLASIARPGRHLDQSSAGSENEKK